MVEHTVDPGRESFHINGFKTLKSLLTSEEAAVFRTYMLNTFNMYRNKITSSKRLTKLMYNGDERLWQYNLRDRSRVEVCIRPEDCPEFCNYHIANS